MSSHQVKQALKFIFSEGERLDAETGRHWVCVKVWRDGNDLKCLFEIA